jgi:hypothetical protein
MRLLLTSLLIGGMVVGVANGRADAAEGKSGEGGKAKEGGGSGGGGGGGGSAGGGGEGGGASVREEAQAGEATKPWELELDLEGHHLLVQNDLEGSAPDKNLMFYDFYARYQVTDLDLLTFYVGFYERFLADQGESGLRADDAYLAYTRLVELPQDYQLRLGARVTFPLSFASQKTSMIIAPTISAKLTKVFGPATVNFRTRAEYFLDKYTTAEGGNANSKYLASVGLDAEVVMPFYQPLSVGALIITEYLWYYTVPNLGPAGAQFFGAVADKTYNTQPTQQLYGGDIFVRYTFPDYMGVRSNLSVSYGLGDPTLGYTSVLRDGGAHESFQYRRSSELFATLEVTY